MEMNDAKLVKVTSILSMFMDCEKRQMQLMEELINTLTDEGKNHATKMATNEEILERV
jgi:hypothetical protein